MDRSRQAHAAAEVPPDAGHAGRCSDGSAARPAALTHTAGLVWVADAELRCAFCSPRAAARLGLAERRALALSRFAGDDPAPMEAHRRALAGEVASFDFRRDGLELHCVLEPLRDADGRPSGVIGSAADLDERRRADQAAAERAVLEAALDQTTDGFAICDAEGRFLFINSTAQQFADSDARGSVLHDSAHLWGVWRDAAGPVSPEEWPLARALRGESDQGREMYHDGADGARHHVLVYATPVRDADGAVIGAVATSTNIDSQKANEERIQGLLARTLQMVSDIVNHSTAVIYLKDQAGRYLLINRRFEQLFGVTNEWIQRHVDDDFLPPETAAAVRANDRQVLASGKAMEFEEVVPSDGAARTYVSLKFPLRDGTGTIYGVCGISTDISERKRMEAELRDSQSVLSAVIESSPDLVVAMDRELRMLAINSVAARAFRSMFGSDAVVGAHLAGAVPVDFAALWRERLARALAGEGFSISESLPIDGVARRFLISLTPTRQDGQVTGVTIFGKDITELSHSEEQARQHQADLAHVLRLHTIGEMAASVAHEVNQPLGAIANYAQGCSRRLEAGSADPQELLQTVRAIGREALRAGQITRRVRELLRKEEPQSRPLDIGVLVRNAVEITAAAAAERGVRIGVDLAPTLPEVHGDPIQIEQVVLNLLLNAIDAASALARPGLVSISTVATPREGVAVVVADNGAGIDPGLREQIFQPFYTTKPGGLGMGLAISRSIIAAHGGRLSVQPAPDWGTEFRFTLPAITD